MRPVLVAALLALVVMLPTDVRAQPPACERPGGSALRDVFWQHQHPPHPLMGQVLAGGKPIARSPGTCMPTPLQQLIVQLWQVIRGGGVVLLGEVHDNVEHHRVRKDILWPRLERLVGTEGLRPAAVFEHIRTTQQEQLDRFYALSGRSRRLWRAPDLLRELSWETSGWPPGKIFEPLFDGALWAKLPILPATAPRRRVRELAKGTPGDVTTRETARLDHARAMPGPLVEALATELAASHCGALPASAVPAMSLAQRYVDAHMAERLVAAAERHNGAFLLAGNGHVRTDRAVPWHLRRLPPGRQAASVMLVEVEEGQSDASAYAVRGLDGSWAADYVLFTPRHIRPDPCEQMRQGKR